MPDESNYLESTSARLIICGSVIVAMLPVVLNGEVRAADTCSCDAYFELRSPSNGRPDFDPSFKPDVPTDQFTALKSKGAFQTMNACRRDARDQGHSCMDNIWKNRFHPSDKPSQCSTSKGIRGSVPYDIKWGVERAACQTGSPIVVRYNAVFKIYRRTRGGRGCGPNLKTAKEVFVSNYEVDCLSIRHREKMGMVGVTKETGIDRPGSNLSGSGVKVGNGTWEACRAACGLRSDCKAWTWVPAGIRDRNRHVGLRAAFPGTKSILLVPGWCQEHANITASSLGRTRKT